MVETIGLVENIAGNNDMAENPNRNSEIQALVQDLLVVVGSTGLNVVVVVLDW